MIAQVCLSLVQVCCKGHGHDCQPMAMGARRILGNDETMGTTCIKWPCIRDNGHNETLGTTRPWARRDNGHQSEVVEDIGHSRFQSMVGFQGVAQELESRLQKSYAFLLRASVATPSPKEIEIANEQQQAVAQSKALKDWSAKYRGPAPPPPAPAAAAAPSAAPASSSSQVAVRPPVPTDATMGATRQWARRGKHNNGHDDTTMGNDYFSLMQDSVTETPASNSNVVLKSRSSRSKSRSPIVRRRVDYKFMSLRNKPHRPVRPVRPQKKDQIAARTTSDERSNSRCNSASSHEAAPPTRRRLPKGSVRHDGMTAVLTSLQQNWKR